MIRQIILLLNALLTLGTAWAQSDTPAFQSRQSIGITTSYSPTSGHVLIGEAEQRQIWTSGAEYTLRLLQRDSLRLDYRAEVAPLYRETDPTAVAYEETIFGNTVVTPISPVRVIKKSPTPVGEDCVASNQCVPIYLVYGGSEATYGMAFSPLGARAVFRPQHRVQPTFATDLGMVISSSPIPVDGATTVNYQFSFGPGAQIYFSRASALRVEYVFRHISNADSGTLNPGIDQGVFRISLCHYW